MKKYLVIEASTNSEWDSVNIALVPITENLLDTIKETKVQIDKFPDDFNWGNISIFYHDFDMKVDDSGELVHLMDLSNETYTIKDEDEIFPNDLSSVENSLDAHEIIFYAEQFSFKCYGKHTGDEFFTSSVPYSTFNI